MTAGTLVWIDSREAFVVRWSDGHSKVEHLVSDVPVHLSETGFTPQDAVEGRRLEHLTRFVAHVAQRIPAADDLLLIGPGTVREHLANQLAALDVRQRRTRKVTCRAAKPLTVPQLVALLRGEVGEEPPRKPIRRRRRAIRTSSRQEAREHIAISAETEED
jgi:hypothetical protein